MLAWLLRIFGRKTNLEPNRNNRRAMGVLYRKRIGSRASARAFAATAAELHLTAAEIDVFAQHVDGIDQRAIHAAKRAVSRST